MKTVPNNEQCKKLLEKHGIKFGGVVGVTETALQSLIREAYRLGRDAHVMKIDYKEKVK